MQRTLPQVGVNFGHRLMARLMDYAFYTLVHWVCFYLLLFIGATLMSLFSSTYSRFPQQTELSTLIGGFFGTIMQLGLNILFETVYGATPGKWLIGLTVIDERGIPPAFVPALIRTLSLFIDGLFLGFVAMDYMKRSSRHQRYGDWLARTMVVKRQTLSENELRSFRWLFFCLLISFILIIGLALAEVLALSW